MSERTIIAAVTDLLQTGLSVEQQILVNEIITIACGLQAMWDAEVVRKATNAERMRARRAELCSTVQHSPHPKRDNKTKIKNPPTPLDTFSAFYEAYPRREARRAAEKQYRHALARGATAEQLLAGAKRYAGEVSSREKKYIKLPASWLNADCWADEAELSTVYTGPWKPLPKIEEEEESTPEEMAERAAKAASAMQLIRQGVKRI